MSVKTKDAVFSSDNRIYLTKEQTQMTKGMAILSMLVLHLFCRKGGDVFGTPIFWLNTDTPFVYILGFLAEICVPLYSMCSGYAHFMLGNAGRLTLQANIRRIIRFLLNYWIIVIVFSIVGLIFKTPDIPVNFSEFIKNLFLLSNSYNGAWWYVATYVLLCLCSGLIYKLVRKMNCFLILCIAVLQYGIMYICDTMGLIPVTGNFVVDFCIRQFDNFFGDVFFCYIIGMIFVKIDIFSRIRYLEQRIWKDFLVRKFCFRLLLFLSLSAVIYMLEKAILMPFYAAFIFSLFNSGRISEKVQKCFLFLGKHSTNIWLIHMFFYLCMFPGLVFSVKYPLFILLYLLGICIVISYAINFIYDKLKKLRQFQALCKQKKLI